MKRIIVLLSFVGGLFLVACNPFAEPSTSLEKALDHIREAKNYRVSIEVDMDFLTQYIDMQFAGDLVYYAYGDDEVYYERDGLRCFVYESIEGLYSRSEIVCDDVENESYGFYRTFSADWFELSGSTYHLRDNHHQDFATFFHQAFPHAEVEDAILTLTNDRLDTITFLLKVDDDTFTFNMTFSAFGQVDIKLPTIE